MLDKLPSLLRLSLCLLISAGVHGGLLFNGWMTSPAESRLAHAPVLVSLRPAPEITSPVATEEPQPSPPVPVPPGKTSRTVEKKPARTAPRTVEKIPSKKIAKALPKKPLVAKTVDEPMVAMASSEMVCMTPQDVVFDVQSTLFAGSITDIAPLETDDMSGVASDKEPQVVPQGVEKDLLDSASASAFSALIEATPNYRSNPLPEYPYLARQRHWQGTVWLLVDVSADGRVDNLRVEQSCGHPVLDRAARRAVRRWQFSPAKRVGLPVSSKVRLPIRFRLEDG